MNTKVESPKIVIMLDFLLNHPDVGSGAKQGFLSSLQNFYKKMNYLSDKQYIALERMYADYSVNHSEWRQNFSDEKKNIFKLCCEFYKTTKWYSSIVVKYQRDQNYIPTEKEYKVLCENKYATLLISEYNKAPAYSLGEMIRVRKKNDYGVGNVLEILPEIDVAVRGGRKYKVYFPNIGNGNTLIMQERHIARVRDCDLNKMSEMEEINNDFA